MLQKLYRYLVTFPLLPSNLLSAVLNMLEQLYRDLPLVPKQLQSCSKYATEAVQVPGDLPLASLFPSNLRIVLNMLEQLYRDLATFTLLTINLRAILNMVLKLYRHLATFLLFSC